MSVAAARPASTVVLLRHADPLEVFLVRRSDSIAFMGGAHVFPGGRVDAADHIAGLRELFEEAGVLLARPLDLSAAQLERYRRELLANAIGFPDIARRE